VTGRLTLLSVWFTTDFPLTTVVFWWQWLAWGANSTGFHVVNVLLHATGAVLVWRVLARLQIPGSGLAALLFAVHPVCVASVAWIAELKNTLSLPFFLLSVLWFLRGDDEAAGAPGAKAGRWHWLSVGAFLLALLSKTSTVMLPVVLLGCAWWRRGCVTRRDLWRVAPYFLLAAGFGALTIWFQAHGAIKGVTVQTEGIGGRLAGAGVALWFYLGKALWPLNLNMIYPRWDSAAWGVAAYLPVLLWGAMLACCWRFRRGWGRPVLFALGGFTVVLFPVLGFFDMFFLTMSRVSDHFQYVALIAVLALVAAGLSEVRFRRVLGVAESFLVAALALSTAHRAKVFASEEGLWRDTLAKNPAAWCAHANLGWILAAQRDFYSATEHLEAAVRYRPENASAQCNLGRVLALQNQMPEAEEHFQAGLKLKPADGEIRRHYAAALADHGKLAAAVEQLRAAQRSQPELGTSLQLAGLFYRTGQFAEAVGTYRQALALQPDATEALNNLAMLLATCADGAVRDGTEAVQRAEAACRITERTNAVMLGTLAAAYAEAGRSSNAVAAAEQAIARAKVAEDERMAAIHTRLLEQFYRAGKAYHEPLRKP
jgi:Flp pilus assembly protein TadD